VLRPKRWYCHGVSLPHRRRRHGFSLIELGIVIAVIVVLAGVVITGAGYFRVARQRTAVDLVLTIRKAARQYALRHSKGLAYGLSTSQNDPRNVTLKGLRGEGFLPTNFTTPWGDNNILVTPHDGPAATPCAGWACVQIDMPVPVEECAGNESSFLVQNLRDHAVQASCSGTTLTVVLR
jgi:prepilin-type N-terminal cleavage/methylation domain-containing protein